MGDIKFGLPNEKVSGRLYYYRVAQNFYACMHMSIHGNPFDEPTSILIHEARAEDNVIGRQIYFCECEGWVQAFALIHNWFNPEGCNGGANT